MIAIFGPKRHLAGHEAAGDHEYEQRDRDVVALMLAGTSVTVVTDAL